MVAAAAAAEAAKVEAEAEAALASAIGACASGGFAGEEEEEEEEEAKSTWLSELEREGAEEDDVGDTTRAEIMLREFIFLSPRSHEEKRVPRGSRNPASVMRAVCI